MKAYAPNGKIIVATLETIPGSCALHEDAFERAADGSLVIEYDGSGTDIDWDGQEAARDNGEVVFIDEAGDPWPESQIRLEGEAEWKPVSPAPTEPARIFVILVSSTNRHFAPVIMPPAYTKYEEAEAKANQLREDNSNRSFSVHEITLPDSK